LRPAFACDLWQWIDAPITVARPHLVREIVEAITKWEPRVRLLSVVIEGPQAGTLALLRTGTCASALCVAVDEHAAAGK